MWTDYTHLVYAQVLVNGATEVQKSTTGQRISGAILIIKEVNRSLSEKDSQKTFQG